MTTASKSADRPVIWVSRCLLGDRVRYDGGHRKHAWMAGLGQIATLRPICPELEAGLGVPRPPIDIVDRRIMNRESGEDVTAQLDQAIDARLADAAPHGVICTARSPSCGAGSARRYGLDGSPSGRGDGRFIARLRLRWPDVPICEGRHLTATFLAQVWRRAGLEPSGMVDFLAGVASE